MSKCETLVATPQLRILSRVGDPALGYSVQPPVLQQYWTDPLNASGKGEWRDVPHVIVGVNASITRETPIIHCDGD